MNKLRAPTATYRLQFNRDFGFSDAARLIPYLHALGISHVYASPYLKARAGSLHGYDIVDHNSFNPEIGDENSFSEFTDALRQHGMGHILDLVPNHMGVGGDDNTWWLDVLENGQASVYADYFDIHWHPVKKVLNNKILLPFLGDHYGTVLERGELELIFDRRRGAFHVRYYGHIFPIDPQTYPMILTDPSGRAARGSSDKLQRVIDACGALPPRNDSSPAGRQGRRELVPECKRSLAACCADDQMLHAWLEEQVDSINGTPGDAPSYDRLHRLLEAQTYRLSYWRVAADEINYRRFFDINDLAGLRMEKPEVFADTHRFVLRLYKNRRVDGLRIDHPDGLYDPAQYYSELRQALSAQRSENHDGGNDCYVVIEKILAPYEHLPAAWPVSGTTGYRFAHFVNGLFVHPDSEKQLDRTYRRFTGQRVDYADLLYDRKKLIIRTQLSSELTVLADMLDGIAQADRRTRDFTYTGLRNAVSEICACFPVYRTYVTEDGAGDDDRHYVHWAIAQAKKRSTAADTVIFDFVSDTLLLEGIARQRPDLRPDIVRFAMRFQQYTAPVMAKSMEDTVFYLYNRLVSLNDVGFDPLSFGISTAAFHHECALWHKTHPNAMVTTSTHDSKRSEDVRARIDVLSEIPDDWRRHLSRWSRINRYRKKLVDRARAPSRNDEYLLYQTLVGAWPPGPAETVDIDEFRERIERYMLKAAREAKIHTSWVNPNNEYEDALRHFVRSVINSPERNFFLADFVPFQKRVAYFGMCNSLSQTLLKLTAPGVPDIYQGNEHCVFQLVDPDNRSPVDYERRRELLGRLVESTRNPAQTAASIDEMLSHLDDGRAKLYVTWRALWLRQRYPDIFGGGEYAPWIPTGPRADCICAFARRLDDIEIITVVSRWPARLMGDTIGCPIGETHWKDCYIDAPVAGGSPVYHNVLTHDSVSGVYRDGNISLPVSALFARLPLALLINRIDTDDTTSASGSR